MKKEEIYDFLFLSGQAFKAFMRQSARIAKNQYLEASDARESQLIKFFMKLLRLFLDSHAIYANYI